MKKILWMYPGAEAYRERIEEICAGKAEVVYMEDRFSEQEFMEKLPGANAIVGDPKMHWMADEEKMKNVEWLQTSWAGVRPFVETPAVQKLIFTNSAGGYGPAVSDHLLAMFLALTRRIQQYAACQKEGNWVRLGNTWPMEGKTALILGAGDLGIHVAKRLKGFDMKTIGFCRRARAAEQPFDRLITIDEFDEVLPEADLIVGCLPSNPKTVGLLNEKRLRLVKKNAIFVNAGRGDVVDTEVLTELTASGHLWGVGLDVTDPEPLPGDHPLWQLPNAIITPHVGGLAFGYSELTEKLLYGIAIDNLDNYLNGKPMKHLVDFGEGY